jgi:hypothetical protein
MESNLIERADMQTIAPLVEEKFNNFPPIRNSEKEKKILSAMEGIKDKDDEDESDKSNKSDSASSLPYYLRNLPAGSDKSKHIVAAAQAAIILGTPPSQISQQFGISLPRINQWKNGLITAGAIGRRDRLSEMLMAYIEQEMKSLLAISMITSDEDWVMRQDAGELAHYIAVKSDRLLMLLQAFGRVDNSREQYQQQLEVMTGNA